MLDLYFTRFAILHSYFLAHLVYGIQNHDRAAKLIAGKQQKFTAIVPTSM